MKTHRKRHVYFELKEGIQEIKDRNDYVDLFLKANNAVVFDVRGNILGIAKDVSKRARVIEIPTDWTVDNEPASIKRYRISRSGQNIKKALNHKVRRIVRSTKNTKYFEFEKEKTE